MHPRRPNVRSSAGGGSGSNLRACARPRRTRARPSCRALRGPRGERWGRGPAYDCLRCGRSTPRGKRRPCRSSASGAGSRATRRGPRCPGSSARRRAPAWGPAVRASAPRRAEAGGAGDSPRASPRNTETTAGGEGAPREPAAARPSRSRSARASLASSPADRPEARSSARCAAATKASRPDRLRTSARPAEGEGDAYDVRRVPARRPPRRRGAFRRRRRTPSPERRLPSSGASRLLAPRGSDEPIEHDAERVLDGHRVLGVGLEVLDLHPTLRELFVPEDEHDARAQRVCPPQLALERRASRVDLAPDPLAAEVTGQAQAGAGGRTPEGGDDRVDPSRGYRDLARDEQALEARREPDGGGGRAA